MCGPRRARGSKVTSITSKKEPWYFLKAFQEKKQQEASRGRDITGKGVVHSTGYAGLWSSKR